MSKYKTCNICENIYTEKAISIVTLDELKTQICIHCLKKADLNSQTNKKESTEQDVALEAIRSGKFKIGK